MKLINKIKTPILITLVMFVICGILYPLATVLLSQIIFPNQANGSLIEKDGKIVGSELIGQDFKDPRLFRCRPSSVNYNVYTDKEKSTGKYKGVSSGGYNYSVSNPKLKERVDEDIKKIIKENPSIMVKDIPIDMVTASGSGLDPHISYESALMQKERIVKNTGLSEEEVETIILNNTLEKWGKDKRGRIVNVLKSNLEIMKKINI